MKKIGIIVTIPHKKSCIVLVKALKYNSKYNKKYFRFKRYYVHDEKFMAKLKAKVLIQSTRPISRNKNFILLKILN